MEYGKMLIPGREASHEGPCQYVVNHFPGNSGLDWRTAELLHNEN